MSEIARDVLKVKLQRWIRDELDERAIHEWAETVWDEGDWPQLPEEDPRSIATEVLLQLDMLNQQWITRDDVPAILAFLETPAGSESQAWTRWRRYWDEVDMEARRRALKSNPYYAAWPPARVVRR